MVERRAGLIDRLDHLNDGDPATTADLGVTGIWLMPVTQSPSYHGYDTTDYFSIEDDYGTTADFRRLVTEAHARGIRVVVDLVLNHTSSQHPRADPHANAVERRVVCRRLVVAAVAGARRELGPGERCHRSAAADGADGIADVVLVAFNFTDGEQTECSFDVAGRLEPGSWDVRDLLGAGGAGDVPGEVTVTTSEGAVAVGTLGPRSTAILQLTPQG